MSLSQLSFLGFLVVTFMAWLPLGKTGRKTVLLVASAVFYGAWDVRFLAVLAFVWTIVLVVPQVVLRCGEQRTRRLLTGLGVALLLLALASLKYAGAFMAASGARVGAGVPPDAGILSRLVLPVGMSFYTFQAISYLVDTYRGVLAPSRSLLDTGLYVAFFPFLLAGPIQKAAAWLPQIEAFHSFRVVNVRNGGERMLLGYLLKTGIADPIAPLVDQVFRAVGSTGSGDLWAGMLLYSLQILADFAGYSLIARGVASCFGYEVQPNFEQPYFSRSFSEFWRRWHISLSTWLQQYLFTPLFKGFSTRLGSRHGVATDGDLQAAYASSAILTMLLAGAWHGAGLTFIAWGLYHGLALALERRYYGSRPIPKRIHLRGFAQGLRVLAQMLGTFLLVSFGWVVFRSDSLPAAASFFSRMMVFSNWTVNAAAIHWLVGGFAMLISVDLAQYMRRDEWAFRSVPRLARPVLYGAIAVHTFLYAGLGGNVAFIYAQF